MKMSPVLLMLLLVAGAAAAGGAIWLADHRGAVPQSGPVMAALMGVFFACGIWVFVALLRAQERGRAKAAFDRAAAAARQPPPPQLEGTVYGLTPGRTYRIAQSFADCYGTRFEQGEILRFRERHFLPYHGGHTLVFEERSIFLQEDQNADILSSFDRYVAPLPAA